MKITLFNFTKKYNSTKSPTGGTEKEVTLKNETNLLSPSFYLKDYANENYLKYNDHYYYVNNVTIVRTNYYLIDCEMDYLASYKQSILDTNAFVLYSSSRFNKYIPDNRISIGNSSSYKYSTAQLFNVASGTGSFDSGTYIVNYITTAPTVGTAGLCWLTSGEARKLSAVLSDQLYIQQTLGMQIGEKVFKLLENVYDSILSIKYIPIDLMEQGTGSVLVKLADYVTGVRGVLPSKVVKFSTNVSIPATYDDFRRVAPYRKLVLFLPCYGFIELDPKEFVGKSSINVKLNIDGITGEGIYTVNDTIRATANFASDITMSTVSNTRGVINALASTGGAITNALNGNLLGVGSNIFNAVLSANSTTTGAVGGLSGNCNVYTNLNNAPAGAVMIVSIDQGTNIEPNTINGTNGQPLNEVAQLGDLTGYVQTVNASVALNASNQIINTINDLLNGGVYIE